METIYDILILGAGPAGISAGLTAHARGRSVLLISNDPMQSPLAKAHGVDNYPGFTGESGRDILSAMLTGLEEKAVPRITGRVTAIMPFDGAFMVGVGQDIYNAETVILATGAGTGKTYPGETDFLGRGVSYCATCDGMLYRGRRVAVLGLSPDAAEEAEFLRSLGCEVTYLDGKHLRNVEIRGEDRVTALTADGNDYPADAVFILRDRIAPAALLTGLALENARIVVNASMETNLPGVFAAGDCTGAPYQIAKAVGEGNLAALRADTYLKNKN